VVRTRMPGGVTGTAREGLPMSIHPILFGTPVAYGMRGGPGEMPSDHAVRGGCPVRFGCRSARSTSAHDLEAAMPRRVTLARLADWRCGQPTRLRWPTR
jgi:hypothetical protein